MAETLPPHIGIALGITNQDWSELSRGDDPAVAATSDICLVAERITAMLLVRVVAWTQPPGTFSDLSTSTVCRELLTNPVLWPASISEDVMEELKKYVHFILSGYNDVPYHNFEHCYHVTASINKLIDMIVNVTPGEVRPCTFGFRDDPLMQLVMVFSALIHDVEHQGIPNRQLALEDDALAIQYNDQSIAEMRSTFIGFSELLKPDYESLRKVIFPVKEDYLRFRSAVINLVLTTDLASPDRTQIGKSKWKEAFGDDYETVERKIIKQLERRQSFKAANRRGSTSHPKSRRMSAYSMMSELSVESPKIELSDDESASLTPDNSDDDEEVELHAPRIRLPVGIGEASPTHRSRRKSGDSFTMSVTSAASGNLSGMALKFQRRLSSIGGGSALSVSGQPTKPHNTRLGLLRTVDLSGEAVETYRKQGVRVSATGASTDHVAPAVLALEEVDELRKTVVMEVIMKAADVAHNLQSYEHMTKWSKRLFLELKKAFVQGRGADPQEGWFKNQTGFLEAYLLPLARKLDDTGVFGDTRGSMFAKIVEDSKERWMKEGASCTTDIIREGHLLFPEADSEDETS